MIYDDLLREWSARKSATISLLVPFRTDHAERERNWRWLERYWQAQLPEAEIVMGSDDSMPFCKTHAVNDAFSRAQGDIIVILDADCYIDVESIRECARLIREARATGHHLWFLPYRRFYRLTEAASLSLLATDPRHPKNFPDPPLDSELDSNTGISFGHWFGALIQVMPREAFEAVGGMDERFRGWGGEDISFMYAVDTMYGRHKTHDGPTYHIHHPTIKGRWAQTRKWEGQDKPESNDWLSTKYSDAMGDRARMRKLIDGN